MSTKSKEKLSEAEIDKIVATQADDDSAWEKPIRVRRKKSASVSIPAELAARATFLARLHREPSVEEWLTHIIQERVELEETAFVGVKRELATKSSA
jgi:siderophore synthetase component